MKVHKQNLWSDKTALVSPYVCQASVLLQLCAGTPGMIPPLKGERNPEVDF